MTMANSIRIHLGLAVLLLAGVALGQEEQQPSDGLRPVNVQRFGIVVKAPVAWPLRLDPQSWTGFRLAQNGQERPLEHICQREIVNAMAALCVASAGMSDEELKRETLRLFNGRRMTTATSSILGRAIVNGLSSNRLQRDREGLLMALR